MESEFSKEHAASAYRTYNTVICSLAFYAEYTTMSARSSESCGPQDSIKDSNGTASTCSGPQQKYRLLRSFAQSSMVTTTGSLGRAERLRPWSSSTPSFSKVATLFPPRMSRNASGTPPGVFGKWYKICCKASTSSPTLAERWFVLRSSADSPSVPASPASSVSRPAATRSCNRSLTFRKYPRICSKTGRLVGRMVVR